MNFEWCGYLDLAEYMTSNPTAANAEACYRTAISRAYYAAFCTAREYLCQKTSASYNGGDAHRKVREDLRRCGKSRIANQLETIMDSRHKADYYNIFNNPKFEALKTINKAKEIIRALKP